MAMLSPSQFADVTFPREGALVYLGNLRLDREEAAVVEREALRYAVLRLGEVLQDVEEDMSDSVTASTHNADDDTVYSERLALVRSRLLRLLGRINRASV
ncbi:hypothetical protein F5B18DRAFT_641140 [Nemania serpens]|nr:hypothetical protein F5B18DRAFT_641140 [Nemania serpens]